MKIKRIAVISAITVVSIFSILLIGFALITSPNIKIFGYDELDVNKLERIRHTVTVVDQDGNIIEKDLYAKSRTFVPLEQVPQSTVDAFISIEDKRFYKHKGVDYKRMLGALKNNVVSASLKEGASTITQQLIKNVYLSNEKTFKRKLREIRLAKKLEKVYTKNEILESYLNVLYFGNDVYGIGQAAERYFGKSVSDLKLDESALLAGIINNPSSFNPVTKPDAALKRRNTVLRRMEKNGKITQSDMLLFSEKEINVLSPAKKPINLYVDNAINEAAEQSGMSVDELFDRQAIVTVDISKGVFNAIFNTMSDILQKIGYNYRIIIVDNSAASVIFDHSNLGSVDNVKRQPGSVIKPFVSFSPAIEKKSVFPASVIDDEVTDFNGYKPKNFSDKYYGKVTVADSLKYSLNVPAVKLTDMVGLPYAKNIASRFGIEFSVNDTGLAVALGGLHDGVTLNALADAYATLGRGGLYGKSGYVSSVYADGKRVYSRSPFVRRAIGEDTAYLITDMLMDCARDGTAKKLSEFGNVAAKTGTVERGEKNSDAYCIAYTPKFTVAVWFGDDTDEHEGKLYGGKQPAEVARAALAALNDRTQFDMPESVCRLEVDYKKLYDEKIVYLASPVLPKRYRKSFLFAKNNVPKRHSYPELPDIFGEDFLFDDFDNFEIVDSLA